MNIEELAIEMSKLDDEEFCLILKDLDDLQLNGIFERLGVNQKLRIAQERAWRKKSAPIALKSPAIPIQLQLELTPEGIAPTPNLILRSSLFSASKTHGTEDHAVRDFEIETYGSDDKKKTKVLLTAFRQFNQLDLDLLLELLKLQQAQDSHLLKITARQLALKATGEDGKGQYMQIKEQLKLLQNASLEIKQGRYSFIGSILNNAFFDEKEQRYVIEFNDKLTPLFQGNNWTGIDTNVRKQLKTNLAKWLHGFFSSHLNSHLPIKLETLYKLSGATDKDMARWVRVRVANALENLQDVFAANGKRFTYQIENGNLYVNKTQSKSQNKSIKNLVIKKSKM